MIKSVLPPNHGDQHLSAGSDPIGSFIEYDVENVGGYLHIATSIGNILLESASFLTLTDAAGLNINSTGIVVACTGGMSETVDSGYSGDYGGGAGGPFDYQLTVAGEFILNTGSGVFLNLPISPGLTGSLWNDSGTVKVS